MDLADLLADGARWALVAVFALAAAEKAETLAHRAAAWHPVILARARWRQHAALLIGASLLADLAAVAALLIRPVSGAVLAAALVGVYSVAARGVHGSGGGEDCRCLWRILSATTRRGLIARNAVFIAFVGIAVLAPGLSISWQGAVLGIVLLGATSVLTRGVDWQGREGSGSRGGQQEEERTAG